MKILVLRIQIQKKGFNKTANFQATPLTFLEHRFIKSAAKVGLNRHLRK